MNEALELARGVHKTGLSKDKFTAVSADLYVVVASHTKKHNHSSDHFPGSGWMMEP